MIFVALATHWLQFQDLRRISQSQAMRIKLGEYKQKIRNESIFTCCWTWCYCCEVSWWCGDSSCCMSGSGRSLSLSWMNCRRCRLCWHGSGGCYSNSCFGHCMCGRHRNMTTWMNGCGSSIHTNSAVGAAVTFGNKEKNTFNNSSGKTTKLFRGRATKQLSCTK